MAEDKQLFIAKFVTHPKGENRYVCGFKIFTARYASDTWWKNASEEDRKNYLEWSLGHEQYHLSTEDINNADFVYEEDKEYYSKYFNVIFLEARITVEPIAPATEV